MFAVVGCFKEDAYENVTAQELLTVKIDTLNPVQANGHASAVITVSVKKDAIRSRRTILLKTNLGEFIGGKGDSVLITANDSFVSEARLKSSIPGEATIIAEIAGLKKMVPGRIEFARAYPEEITVNVDSFSIVNSFKSESIITASLVSGNGVCSIGQAVSFSVTGPEGHGIGAFLNGVSIAETDVNGKAKIRYSAGNTNIAGRLKITAETKKADNSTISANTYIYLTN